MAAQDSFSKSRSPRYPRISIDSAIGYARKLYEEAHRSAVDPDTAARLMGFRGKSGASAVALGAVRQFGLVDGLRGSLKVSDLAMKILQPVSADEEEEARHEAAFKPEVYDTVVAHFDGELPRSDEPLKAHLIRTLGFSRSGAEDCISTLRKTLSELEEFKSSLPRTEPIRAEVKPDPPVPDATSQLKAHLTAGQDPEIIRIPLTRECTAELRLTGEVTSAAVDRLIQYIELMKGVWADS